MGKKAHRKDRTLAGVIRLAAGAYLLGKKSPHSILSFFSVGSILSAGSILSIERGLGAQHRQRREAS